MTRFHGWTPALQPFSSAPCLREQQQTQVLLEAQWVVKIQEHKTLTTMTTMMTTTTTTTTMMSSWMQKMKTMTLKTERCTPAVRFTWRPLEFANCTVPHATRQHLTLKQRKHRTCLHQHERAWQAATRPVLLPTPIPMPKTKPMPMPM